MAPQINFSLLYYLDKKSPVYNHLEMLLDIQHAEEDPDKFLAQYGTHLGIPAFFNFRVELAKEVIEELPEDDPSKIELKKLVQSVLNKEAPIPSISSVESYLPSTVKTSEIIKPIYREKLAQILKYITYVYFAGPPKDSNNSTNPDRPKGITNDDQTKNHFVSKDAPGLYDPAFENLYDPRENSTFNKHVFLLDQLAKVNNDREVLLRSFGKRIYNLDYFENILKTIEKYIFSLIKELDAWDLLKDYVLIEKKDKPKTSGNETNPDRPKKV